MKTNKIFKSIVLFFTLILCASLNSSAQITSSRNQELTLTDFNFVANLNSTSVTPSTSNCDIYKHKRNAGRVLVLVGTGAFLVGTIAAIEGGTEGYDGELVAGNVLQILGVGSAITGFVIKGKGKRLMKANNCSVNLQFKGNSVGVAMNF